MRGSSLHPQAEGGRPVVVIFPRFFLVLLLAAFATTYLMLLHRDFPNLSIRELLGLSCVLCCFPLLSSAASLTFDPGTITTIAGTGTAGDSGDGQAALAATFREPAGVAVDAAGNVYIADTENNTIRKLDANTHMLTRIAGTGMPGYSGDNGPASSAMLCAPKSLAVDSVQNLLVADSCNNTIRRIDPAGVIRTVAGSGPGAITPVTILNLGDGGLATAGWLLNPTSVAVDLSGNLFVADTGNHRVRRIDSVTHLISTVAGSSTAGYSGDGASGAQAQLNAPQGLAVTSGGTLYIADTGNNVIRQVNLSSGQIQTYAGGGLASGADTLGDGGLASAAVLNSPRGLAVDASNSLIVADAGNDLLRRIDGSSGIITILAGVDPLRWNAIEGAEPPLRLGGDASAVDADILQPSAVALDASGNVYVADTGNDVVRAINPSAAFLSFLTGNTAVLNVTNRASAPVSFTGASTAGPNQADFTVGSDSCIATLLPGASCKIQVSFHATGAGEEAASLQLVAAGGSLALQVPMAAESSNPGTLLVSPDALAFSLTLPAAGAQASPPQAITVTNGGASSVAVGSPVLVGSGASQFTITGSTCPNSLAAAASCALAVSFSPTAVNSYTADVALSGLSSSVQLSGIAAAAASANGTTPVSIGTTPTVSASASALMFPNNTLFVSGSPQSITFSNASGDAISGNPAGMVGASDFAIVATTCSPILAAHATCSVSVNFTPAIPGLRTATLKMWGPGPTQVTVALSGTGGVPLQFIPVQPCRLADTRLANGSFGGPEIEAGLSRTFAIPQSSCNIPANAAAFSLNVTAIPQAALGYLAIWPAGQAKPLVSTLNSDGRVKANAVIVGAGTSGGVNVYVSDASHVVLDIDGYFAPAGTGSGLDFYAVSPCRLVDTRGPASAFGQPSLTAGSTRSFNLTAASCNLPPGAEAYSLNFTVVPHGSFGYLSVWPTGSPQPYVSTLNAFTGTVTSNAAIVPAGTNGAISTFVTHDTDLIIDVNGYFAAPSGGSLKLYAMTPCRILDTRTNGAAAPTGTVSIPVASSSCAVPSQAAAYVTNATIVPPAAVGFLALWPDGEQQPTVSTLNSYDGALSSNMAIVPTANGTIDAYLSQASHLILDISGYFAP